MAVKIDGVEPHSRAEKAGVRAGDILLAINGHEITDVLDYRFFETERNVRLNLCRSGKEYSAEIVKPQYAQLGLCFDISRGPAATNAFSALSISFLLECGKLFISKMMMTGFPFCSAIISR